MEAAFLDGGLVGVRDSKNPTGPALVFTPGEWDAFTAGIQGGEFDCHCYIWHRENWRATIVLVVFVTRKRQWYSGIR